MSHYIVFIPSFTQTTPLVLTYSIVQRNRVATTPPSQSNTAHQSWAICFTVDSIGPMKHHRRLMAMLPGGKGAFHYSSASHTLWGKKKFTSSPQSHSSASSTYGINLYVSFRKVYFWSWPWGHQDSNSTEIFRRCTYGMNLKILCCLILMLFPNLGVHAGS